VLILVRHGRTALNAAGKLQGRLDVPLDDVGREQATAVANHVGPVDELISSPLLRAVQTAEAFGVPFVQDERWVELSYGRFEGMSSTEAMSAEAWEQWRLDPNYVPDGGESLVDLDERVRSACEAIAERARDHDVVIVTHVSPIKAAVAWAIGAPIDIAWRSHLSQASVCRIEIRGREPVLTAFNEKPPSPS